ncbi:MAG: putative lipid II flippase FtsW [Candidatus Scatovivens sp.]
MSQKGKKINFFTKGSCDTIIIIVTIMLVALGLIMVLSASSPASLSESGDSYKYFKKQLLATVAGTVGLIIISRIDYSIYKKFKWMIYIVIVGLLFLVGIMGMSAGGATRWINIAGFNFQPSEVAKIAFIIFFAIVLTELKENKKINKINGFIVPMLFLIAPVVAIFIVQNHFSATLIIVLITCIQMFVAGVSLKYFIIIALGGTCAVIGILLSGSFRSDRIQTWLNPFSDPTGDGWQIIQSLYAIGSGGLFGVGLGESKQKYLYLPEPQNDFIFSVLAEELGFFGCVVVIILFLIFIWRGIVIAMRSRDTLGCLIAIGIVSLIGIQAVINIAVVSGTIPVTGMPLPFFSYGGTAIVTNLVSVRSFT